VTARLRGALGSLCAGVALATALCGAFIADRLAIKDARQQLDRHGTATVNLHFFACRQLWLAGVAALVAALALLRGRQRWPLRLGAVALAAVGLSLWLTPAHLYIGTATHSALDDSSSFVWAGVFAGVGALTAALAALVSWRARDAL
jgi:hypothetical protein